MSNDRINMGSSWRSLAGVSTRLSTLKEYAQQRDLKALLDLRRNLKPGDSGFVEGQNTKQTWAQWAEEKYRNTRNGFQNASGNEQVLLFPGWATRRYHQDTGSNKIDAQFSIDVFVSGYASRIRPPEFATRSQKAFMRLAKAFAALPKLPQSGLDATNEDLNMGMSRYPLTPSSEDLIKQVGLPLPPSQMTEDAELQVLEHQFQHAGSDSSSVSSKSEPPTPPLDGSPHSYFSPSPPPSTTSSFLSKPENNSGQSTDLNVLRSLHANLDQRLRPFWSNAIANRLVRISVYITPPQDSAGPDLFHKITGHYEPRQPLYTQDLITSPLGAFQCKMSIPWERICEYEDALQMAFGRPQEEHDLYLVVELVPEAAPISLPQMEESRSPSAQAMITIPITQSKIRLISDIDDTIKLSNILGGARAVFRNVFVRHLEEVVIKGMGQWYEEMWAKGIRFHYVSNGPFELLPVIIEFMKVSNLPQGSVKMKSYNGRSLFNGLLSAPASRKRDGIVDILDNFHSSQFFLVGDTGEQDLELYSTFASERHNQILAVFIRDCSGSDVAPLEDPTGERIKRAAERKKNANSRIPTSYFSNMDETSSPILSQPVVTSPPASPSFSSHTPTQDNTEQARISKNYASSRNRLSPPPRTPGRSSSLNIPSLAKKISTPYIPRVRTPVRSPSEPTLVPRSLPTNFFNDVNSTSSSLSSKSSNNESLPPSITASDIYDIPIPGVLMPNEIQALPAPARKRYDLQLRVYKARMIIPSHIPLRIFRQPEECIETSQILDKLLGDNNNSALDT